MLESQAKQWYALRTFNRRELDVKQWLEDRGHEVFVPMRMVEHIVTGVSKPVRSFVPAIHNYLFSVRQLDTRPMRTLVSTCPWPVAILRKAGSDIEPYLVEEEEMNEFRLLSDPSFKDSVFLEADEADAKPGKEVLVTKGAFKGLRGRLHRVKNNYYFIKTFGGMAVQVRISRWYCKVMDTPIEEECIRQNSLLQHI